MKKNRGSFLIALWWLTACLCLGVLLGLLAPRQSRPSEDENRMLAGFPELTQETLLSGDFFAGIEDFLSDGFFARAEVIDFTDSVLEIFNRQTEEQRQMQEEAETNLQLQADAGDWEGESWEEEAEEAVEEPVATPEPTPSPSPTPTAAPTATPTFEPTPTPEPTEEPVAAVTQTALPTATPAPTAEPTATPSPVPSPTPAPTASPRVIVPLDPKAEYTLELIVDEEKTSQVYSYSAENVSVFAQNLNDLRAMLPEDGEVHYLHVPVAAVGRRLTIRKSEFIGWESTMEEALATQVVEGVNVHDVPAILNDALVRKEDLYYYTDHHWTPLGAWYAVNHIMQQRGYPGIPYEEYQYTSRILDRDKVGREDWLHLLHPLSPTHSYVLTHLTEETELAFMHYKSTSYTGYINNTRTPWRRFDTGFGSERKALLISDSFGNVFLPYLLPYYGTVHMTDLRGSYFDEKEAGGTFRELVAYHGIDDIYVVLSTSNGINSANSLEVFHKTISK